MMADLDKVCDEVERRGGGAGKRARSTGRDRQRIGDDKSGELGNLGPRLDMDFCIAQTTILGTNVEVSLDNFP